MNSEQSTHYLLVDAEPQSQSLGTRPGLVRVNARPSPGALSALESHQ
jgi:hypothetical protein